jgi:hypothetical protein
MARLPLRDLRLLLLGASLSASIVLGGVVMSARADLGMSNNAATSIVSSLRAAEARQVSVASATDPSSVSLPNAVSIAYMERHRLGLGSPFRLIEHVALDRRLPPDMRREVGWALIGRTLRGEGYAIDTMGFAAEHLRLVERAVLESESATTGEHAVRIAYALGASEGVVPPWLPSAAEEAAALVRDRRLAQHDARRLVASARSGDVDPLGLLPLWRQQRRFAVEAPASSASPAEEEESIALAARLLTSLRSMDSGAAMPAAAAGAPRPSTMLPRAAALRIAQLSNRYLPPQGAVVLAMRTHADIFADSTLDEETLVVRRALVQGPGRGARRLGRATLAAGAGLRAFAQEVAWLPGDQGPSEATMKAELPGVTVQFDSTVRESWQPYYRRMLVSAVRDLRRVLPSLDLAGLRVRFVDETNPQAALALHDPGKRMLVLPVRTAAGVLAHELAHDLDWQAARRIYNRRGSYSTDIALAEGRGRVNEKLRGLASATLVTPRAENGWYAPHDRRPAEVFARNFDWLVAASLARDGRSNGYLSSVQDEVIVGHAAVLPREVGGAAVSTLVDLVEDVTTPLAEGLREWLAAEWGSSRARKPGAIVRAAGDAQFTVHGLAPVSAFEVPDRRGGCIALARMASESRARGILNELAATRPSVLTPTVAAAVAGTAPWSPAAADEMVARLATDILVRVEATVGFGSRCGDVLARVR